MTDGQKRIEGQPPFFIQGMRSDGATYITGYTDDPAKAYDIWHTLSKALAEFHGYMVTFGQSEEDRKANAMSKIREYDRYFTDTVVYQVVSILNYDRGW